MNYLLNLNFAIYSFDICL